MKENNNIFENERFNRFNFDQLQQEKLTYGDVVSIQPYNGLDHYNPSNAFKHNNEWYHAVREETRDNEV